MSENNTEQAILEAAQEIFLDKGYAAASTVKIAEKAGVTHAMLHYYFRSKEKIFQKILDKEIETMFSAISGVMSPDAGLWETISMTISIHFDFLNTHRRVPFLLLSVVESNPEMLEKYKRKFENIVMTELARHAERMSRWEKEGGINEVDLVQLLYTVISLNVSAFLGIPPMKKVLKMSDSQIDDFLVKRKEEILRTVYMRLYTK